MFCEKDLRKKIFFEFFSEFFFSSALKLPSVRHSCLEEVSAAISSSAASFQIGAVNLLVCTYVGCVVSDNPNHTTHEYPCDLLLSLVGQGPTCLACHTDGICTSPVVVISSKNKNKYSITDGTIVS